MTMEGMAPMNSMMGLIQRCSKVVESRLTYMAPPTAKGTASTMATKATRNEPESSGNTP